MAAEPDDPDQTHLQKLPPYTYVPGRTPHPVSDPRGHWRERPIAGAEQGPDGDFARRLFDEGYYWEAHEVWEHAWQAQGRAGPEADFLKGLIKLAACGVKCLEGNSTGARRHAQRAAALFARSMTDPAPESAAGYSLNGLMQRARTFAQEPPMASAAEQRRAEAGGVPILGRLPDVET